MIIIPQRQIWTRQPSHPVGIDWSNPITSQLVRRWNFGVDNYDHVTNVPSYAESGSPTPVVSSRGRALSFSGGDDSIHSGSGTSDLNGTEISISFWAHNLDASSNTILFAGEAGSSNHRINISLPYDGIIYWDFGILIEGGRITKSVGSLSGQLSHWVFVASGGNYMAMYQDGDLLHSENTGYPTGYAGSSYMSIGSYRGSLGFTGNISNVAIFKRALDAREIKSLYENPWQLDKRRSRHVFVGASGGSTDVTTSGSISSISLSAATGSATSSVSATAAIEAVSLSAATGSATGSAVATGAVNTVSLSAATGDATGSAAATGSVTTVSLTAATGTASTAGDATADGAVAALSLSAATCSATGTAVASGAITAVSLTAATGAASTAGDVVASASMPALSLSAPTGAATGAATTSAAIAAVSLSAATGTAAAGADVSASGSIAAIGLAAPTGTATPSIQAQAALAALSLYAPTGAATGTATTSAALATISLSAATGTASAGADVSASGSIAVIGLTAPVGAATISIEAQAAIAAVFMSAPTGVATWSATCSGAMPAISLSACRGAASNGLEDLPYLSQMVFARTSEQREFARINDGRYFVRRT